jgi:hypothetical protein
MGRCKYEKLAMLETALDEIRKLPDLKEPKPGIFYLKSQGFMHFHEKDSKIWADVKDGDIWGEPLDIPGKVTKTFSKKFINEVFGRYLKSGGKT